MGYTTEFDGEFELDKLPPAEVIVRMNELDGVDGREMMDTPASYNQWQLTKDCRHIKWDGGEKFRDYVEWLQYIIDVVLLPYGVFLRGTVAYSGEDAKDNGILTIENDIVVQRKHQVIAETLEELQKFQAFVLGGPYGDAIQKEWLRTK